MTNEATINKLIEMHMSPMADAFRNQLKDITMKDVAFEDRFGMMVDIEYATRKSNRLQKLIKDA